MVVETAGVFIGENKSRGRKDGGVGGKHGLRKTKSLVELIFEESEKSLHMRFLDWASADAIHEGMQQSFGVLGRILGNHFNGDRSGSGSEPAAEASAASAARACARLDLRGRGADVHHHAFLSRIQALQWKIAKERPITRAGGLIVERALDLHPLNC